MSTEIIDFHTHNFPDAVAPLAIASMSKKLEDRLSPFGNGTLANQLADMDRFGIAKSVVCPVATNPRQFRPILNYAKACRDGDFGEAAATRLVQLCSVHPDDPDFAAHLKEIADNGFKGIKIHPYYQEFFLDDPARVPFFKAARDCGLIVIAHCGLDIGYPDSPMSCGPKQIAGLMRNVPDLTFVAGHLGGCGGNPPHAVDELLEFPGCYADTAVIAVCWDDPESQRVMAEWPAERLVFGTDYFWSDTQRLIDWVRWHRPQTQDLEKIFAGNAKRLLGI
jgi:predicted TIM-barrel fold metal-dependent hydrolase